eukprot:187550-Rhodomonas_salina.1
MKRCTSLNLERLGVRVGEAPVVTRTGRRRRRRRREGHPSSSSSASSRRPPPRPPALQPRARG